jgi:rare lipoprotein A (peptidoglycan hydrolase)
MAFIAVLALVTIPATVRSRTPNEIKRTDTAMFRQVRVESFDGRTATAQPTTDSGDPSAGPLTPESILLEPAPTAEALARPSTPSTNVAPTKVAAGGGSGWNYDARVSWYGPGFYGGHTACGYTLTTSLQGVANRTLPCGTLVTFRSPSTGRTITVPVVDRGPYVSGRNWDLTGGACTALGACVTGPLYWRIG